MISVDISAYNIEIKRHVFIQAMKRGIHPDIIEDTLKNGRVEHYGKHGVKFVLSSRRTIVCVGQIIGMKITIFTIEEGN